MTVDYQLNLPEYLAKCINKDKPQIHCNGQCVLMKKIREKEKEETKKNLVMYEYNSLYTHQGNIVYRLYQPKEGEAHSSFFPPYLIDYKFNHHTSLFRPPIS